MRNLSKSKFICFNDEFSGYSSLYWTLPTISIIACLTGCWRLKYLNITKALIIITISRQEKCFSTKRKPSFDTIFVYKQ